MLVEDRAFEIAVDVYRTWCKGFGFGSVEFQQPHRLESEQVDSRVYLRNQSGPIAIVDLANGQVRL